MKAKCNKPQDSVLALPQKRAKLMVRRPNLPISCDCEYHFLMQTVANDDGVSVFESVRPRLFGIAYRMLGSAAEAEDIVRLPNSGYMRAKVAQLPKVFVSTTSSGSDSQPSMIRAK